MKFQRLTEFDTDTLIHEMEVRGYWSIPKWNVKAVNAAVYMDAKGPYRQDPRYLEHMKRDAARGVGEFLRHEGALIYSEKHVDPMMDELIASVHVVTEMPRELLRASLNAEGE